MRSMFVPLFRARSPSALAVIGIACSAAIAATSAGAAEGRCLIVVEGHTYLKGGCNITIEPGGSFKVGVGEQSRSKYFAYVTLGSEPGFARGSWNGVEADDHAHSDLGSLKRKGACWSNERAEVCAWQRAR
jgi:hypothetical protein